MGVCDDDKSQSPSLNENDDAGESESDTIDPQVGQQETWVTAENLGYSPLSDLDSSSPYMMVSMGPMEDDASESGGDNTDYQGAFYMNPSAFQTDNQNSSQQTGESLDEQNDDFQTIANSALSALDEEYARTIKGEGISPSPETPDPKSSDHFELIDDNDLKIISAAFDEGKNERQMKNEDPSLFTADWDHAPVSKTLHSNTTVDTDAVKKAVQEISQNGETPFHQKFAAWQKRQNHEIIPQTPYKAFQRSTEKAISATATLSRSATIAEALLRLYEQKLLETTAKSLTIDVVGVDHVECESIERIQATFRPIIRWLGAWKTSNYETIKLRLVGRDLSSTTSPDPIDLLTPQVRSKLVKAQATCHSGIYHEWYSKSKEVPSMIIAFNAGIWGYQEWPETIKSLSESVTNVPMVITAYNLLEAQEDMDVIKDSVSATSKLLWEAEENSFGSKVLRETKTSSNEYRENSGWQAWLL